MKFRLILLAFMATAAGCSDQSSTPQTAEAEQPAVNEVKSDGDRAESGFGEIDSPSYTNMDEVNSTAATGDAVSALDDADAALLDKQRELVEFAREQRSAAVAARAAIDAANEQLDQLDPNGSAEEGVRLRAEKKKQSALYDSATAAYQKAMAEIETIGNQINSESSETFSR